MLENLVIKNVVLIEEVNIDFTKGLCVLTGETGSGKSILLEALTLATGGRYSTRLLRNGEKQGYVIATFNVSNNAYCKKLLEEQGIDFEDTIILRRNFSDDGKNKAFINDVPVSQNFLKLVGDELVEIHGQHDQTHLLNPIYHRTILDGYGNLKDERQIVSDLYDKMKSLQESFNNFNSQKENIAKEKDYLDSIIKELEDLDIKEGEEEQLNDKRISMMNKEKIIDVLNSVKNIVDGNNPIVRQIANAQSYLSRSSGLGENLLENGKNVFDEINDFFEKSILEFNEGLDKIESIYSSFDFNEEELNNIEERLFLIRGIARKYNIKADYIPDFLIEIKKKLENLENQTLEIGDLEEKLKSIQNEFLEKAEALSKKRKIMSEKMAKELMDELIPLKMGKVVFKTEFKKLTLENCNKYGIDEVKFMASTNIGTELDDLSKIASGGELSRFMLALKVVLLKTKSIPTLIFDEIDSGVSGAVADAIGERLNKLGQSLQVFTITHLPQVASKGSYHIKISKESNDNSTKTLVEVLNKEQRRIEIAKMISNSNVGEEALKMADKLLNN